MKTPKGHPAKVLREGCFIINHVHKACLHSEGHVEEGEAWRDGLFDATAFHLHQLPVAPPLTPTVVYRFLWGGRFW